MHKMGYRKGEGLGKDKQGIVEPLSFKVSPPGVALDFINADPVMARIEERLQRSAQQRQPKRTGDRLFAAINRTLAWTYT